MSKAKFVEKSIENQFGQTINPGDEVVYLGSSWGGTSVRTGIFAGVYMKDTESSWDYAQGRYGKLIEKPVEPYISGYKIKGIKDKCYRWNKNTKTGSYEDVVRTATLHYNRIYRLDTPLSAIKSI